MTTGEWYRIDIQSADGNWIQAPYSGKTLTILSVSCIIDRTIRVIYGSFEVENKCLHHSSYSCNSHSRQSGVSRFQVF